MKKRIIKITVIVILIVFLFLIAFKYGWRLLGFYFCESPTALSSTCEITDTNVKIQGVTFNSAKKFDGYKYEIKDDVLYLGIHCKVFLASSKLGTFNITIDTPKKINKVIIKGHGAEQIIYPLENKQQ